MNGWYGKAGLDRAVGKKARMGTVENLQGSGITRRILLVYEKRGRKKAKKRSRSKGAENFFSL